MATYYRRKQERVTATVLKGDVTINGDKFKAGDYLVQSEGGGTIRGMSREAFEGTYEADVPEWPRLQRAYSVYDTLPEYWWTV